MSGTEAKAPIGDHLEIKDSRTGKIYYAPITDETIRTADLKQIKVNPDDFGIMGYDPAFMNTASCRSAITFIDGDKGILRYRGYPIDQLAEKASFLEIAWLLRHGELPTQAEYNQFVQDVTFHTYVHENIRRFMEGFRYDAHPMSMLSAGVAALSSFYPTAKNIYDPRERDIAFIRLIAKMPTIAAFAYRHVKGLPYVYPDNSLPYAENFLSMIARMSEPKYEAHPVYARAIDILFILHADHEQNCSTNAVRAVGSSHVDPYSAVAAGISALYGPLHGGANEAVLRMLDEIGDVPVHLQVKLLRFLQDHVVQRVGGLESRTVDARVVAATNRDLKTMIADGRFREDLYYRLGVIVIQVPPLRERGDDLRLLAEYFLEFYGREHKRRIKGFTQAALRAIMAHAWPGNVRELENRMQRAVIMSQDAYLRPEDLELESVGGSSDPLPTLQSARDEAERRLLVEALTRNAGNVTRAARDIEVSRPTLHDLLRKHGLEAARFRRGGAAEPDDDEPGSGS